jgi:hypothetical protein
VSPIILFLNQQVAKYTSTIAGETYVSKEEGGKKTNGRQHVRSVQRNLRARRDKLACLTIRTSDLHVVEHRTRSARVAFSSSQPTPRHIGPIESSVTGASMQLPIDTARRCSTRPLLYIDLR